LGIGNQIDQNSPVQIGTDTDWETASAGGFFSIALKTNGTLWTWGYNFYGQLGDGTKINKKSPVQVGTDHAWKTISAGWAHALALQADATLWAWGYNYSGQVGNGTQQHQYTPLQISQDKHWTQIAAGGFHSVALTKTGALYTWGDNEYGALGVDSTTTATNTPQPMGSNTDWNYIDAGSAYTLALKTNGTLWTWGGNYYGQLGDGTNQQKNSPVQIGTDQDWTTLTSCYDYHTLIVKTDGSLWACGRNHKGQLGNGTTINQSNFTQIACPTVAVFNPTPAPPFEIFPNPASEQIWLQWTNEHWSNVQFEISDMLGKTFLSKQSLPFSEQIGVESLPKGVYLLHLFHDEGYVTRVFVKI
jgi:alpha-tubulin suppressor-like RCC1 family protein